MGSEREGRSWRPAASQRGRRAARRAVAEGAEEQLAQRRRLDVVGAAGVGEVDVAVLQEGVHAAAQVDHQHVPAAPGRGRAWSYGHPPM